MKLAHYNRLIILFLFFSLIVPEISNSSGADEYISKKIEFYNNNLKIESSGNYERRLKVGLVLSGGGARGIAHIGVLKVLEQNNIPVDLIVGTSIGSVIGGLYAAGYSPDQIESITKKIDWQDIYRDETQRSTLFLGQKGEQDRYLMSVRFKNYRPFIPTSLSPGQKVLSILSDIFLKAQYQARNDYNNLRVPFRTVATDLISGEQVVLRSGNLAESINASLAVPLLFSPVIRDSMLLVDGGLRSNLPVDVAKEAGMDLVIAVDISAKLRSPDQMKAPWEIADQVTTIMTVLAKNQQRKQADILIQPALDNIANTDFLNLEDLIKAGADAAESKLPEIRARLDKNSGENDHFLIDSIKFDSEDKAIPVNIYDKLKIYKNLPISRADIAADMDLLLHTGRYCQATAQLDTSLPEYKLQIDFKNYSILSAIEFKGNYQIPSDELKTVMLLKAGVQLNAIILQEDLSRIVQRYRDKGFSLMNIKKTIFESETGLLHIEIDEGYINKILIEGNKKTKNYVIRREFTFKEGDIFNWVVIQRGIQNVYATGLYDRVSVDIAGTQGQNNLIIKVEEKTSIRMRFGGKFDTERKSQAYVEFGDENFFGGGIKANLLSRIGMRDGLVALNIRNDRIFTTYLTFTLQGYHSWEINPINNETSFEGKYREERTGVRFQIGQQLRRLGQLIADLRIETATDERYSGVFNLDQTLELRTFAIRSITDKRDRINFPTKGIYNQWLWETGSKKLLDSEESYTKAAVNLENYSTILKRNTFHMKFMIGIGDESTPFSENYRLGGLHSFYGLQENEFYGKQILLLNLEYRYKAPFKILTDTYFSVRYDFGGVWRETDLIFSSDDFFSGIGSYIAFDTVLGPLYFGWGQMSEGRSQGYVSLGFDF
ncbi:MAG: patatin-like phospholipase family protein [Calditrichaceae bacterium]